MNKASDLAALTLVSEREHKNRASTQLRLAGGIRSQARADLGLTVEEKKVLTAAASLLEALAKASKEAAKLARKRADLRNRREIEAEQLISNTFGSISTIADKVALIAAVLPYMLRPGFTQIDQDSIERAYQEALETIRFKVAASELSMSEHLAMMWTKFGEAKEAYIDQFQRVILSIDRGP